MKSLDEIYYFKWFENYLWMKPIYNKFAQVINRILKPKSILEIGCGSGFLIDYFNKKGIEVIGIDGSKGARATVSVEIKDKILLYDVRRSLKLKRKFDLIISIEVAEHIEKEFVNKFLDNLTKYGDRILLTAADVSQSGHHHVNCQPKAYWINLLEKKDFRLNTEISLRLYKQMSNSVKEMKNKCSHVYHNVMYFEKC